METNNINEAYNDRGMDFPIVLEDGGDHPISSSTKLIRQNLRALILYELGFRIRQEEFGTRLWECLEEPNTQALNFLIYEFLKDAILTYEGRIELVDSEAARDGEKLTIDLYYRLAGSSSTKVLGIEYKL